jgi:DNA-binding HxlR family transcriptional regulator
MATPDATTLTREEIRAGSRVLSIFENPLNARILRAHAHGSKRLAELQEQIGWAAQSTMRAAISNLCELGALEKQSVSYSPYAVATTLSRAGEEMLFVADEVEAWLTRCPAGPIDPDGEEAKAAIKAFTGGWSSTLTRALVSGPFTLTEMNAFIPNISYPALERRVSWMRTTGLIEPVKKRGRGTPYVVTDWLRHAVAPICAAGRCERRHLQRTSVRATNIEVEAAFLLAVPLTRLPLSAKGSCALVVQVGSGGSGDSDYHRTGVTVEVAHGEIVSCASEVASNPGTWAVGTSTTWLDVVLDGRTDKLQVGGPHPQLALDLAGGIHRALFDDR